MSIITTLKTTRTLSMLAALTVACLQAAPVSAALSVVENPDLWSSPVFLGDGVIFIFSDDDSLEGLGYASGGKAQSAIGGSDFWFHAGDTPVFDTPAFPGNLNNEFYWRSSFVPDSGAVSGSDNWMKVIRDSDGAVSWAQFEFDFSTSSSLIDIPLYVTDTTGADFTLAQAIAAVPEPSSLALLGLGGLLLARRRRD